jgi:hypothetical protein
MPVARRIVVARRSSGVVNVDKYGDVETHPTISIGAAGQ